MKLLLLRFQVINNTKINTLEISKKYGRIINKMKIYNNYYATCSRCRRNTRKGL